jgi:biotin carboxylase
VRAPFDGEWFVLVESNTTGSGRLFCLRARELGLRPLLIARDPHRYPYVERERVEHVTADTADAAAVHAACRALGGKIAGITSSSEYYIGVASEVARLLALPGQAPEAVRRCRDKHAQRTRLRAAGLPCPAFARASSVPAAVAAAEAIGYPVVVKPTAGSGSAGVRLCAGRGDVAAAASLVLGPDAAALGLPAAADVLVEEYLDGAEFSVELVDGQVIGITRKHLGPEPYFVETGHDFPAPLAPPVAAALRSAATGALAALGLDRGGAHVELRLSAGGSVVVEVNPRLAGGMIPQVVDEAVGIDLVLLVVAGMAGLPVSPRPARHGAASIRFLVAHDRGRLAAVSGLEQARAVPGVVDAVLTRCPGEELRIRHSFADRLGYVVARGEDNRQAAEAAQTARALIKVDIEQI